MRDCNLRFLCDPQTKQPVFRDGNTLCTADAAKCYPVREGVPVFAAAAGGTNIPYARCDPAYTRRRRSAGAMNGWEDRGRIAVGRTG